MDNVKIKDLAIFEKQTPKFKMGQHFLNVIIFDFKEMSNMHENNLRYDMKIYKKMAIDVWKKFINNKNNFIRVKIADRSKL